MVPTCQLVYKNQAVAGSGRTPEAKFLAYNNCIGEMKSIPLLDGACHTGNEMWISHRKATAGRTTIERTKIPSASTRHKDIEDLPNQYTSSQVSVRRRQNKTEDTAPRKPKSGSKDYAAITSGEDDDVQTNSEQCVSTAKAEQADWLVRTQTRSLHEEILKQVQNNDENNVFANERQHSEKHAAECADERAALANLIANLTLDTEENKMILKQYNRSKERIIDLKN
ncbi:hypothetical protein Tco_0439253 [Tanacetum coccineum]